MKVTAFVPILCVIRAVASQTAIGMEAVKSCNLGRDSAHRILLLRDHPIGGTAVYYLSKDGGAPVRLNEGDEDRSRGDDVQVECVGEKERALVISGEFTSNHLQGVAIRLTRKKPDGSASISPSEHGPKRSISRIAACQFDMQRK
ncbi:hypothetical protein [Paraburkholderia sp. J41]|uniref:hypothetical protein n=1 Tax=Paraburkholderia sp. J41 TaxID=2805433 RepID=UPI002AC33079|nr:hypothetical protein [Paraburkholderia sp. J41]